MHISIQIFMHIFSAVNQWGRRSSGAPRRSLIHVAIHVVMHAIAHALLGNYWSRGHVSYHGSTDRNTDGKTERADGAARAGLELRVDHRANRPTVPIYLTSQASRPEMTYHEHEQWDMHAHLRVAITQSDPRAYPMIGTPVTMSVHLATMRTVEACGRRRVAAAVGRCTCRKDAAKSTALTTATMI